MPASLEDIEALYGAVKNLRTERQKMERLSEKARNAPLGRVSQKASTDLHWQAFHVGRLEHTVHAAAVNAGVADARPYDQYRPYSVKLTGFHEYEVVPPLPRGVQPPAERLTLTRDVPKSECPWLDRDMREGEAVYRFSGVTYGCLGPNGIAVSAEPDATPFFEMPRDALAPA